MTARAIPVLLCIMSLAATRATAEDPPNPELAPLAVGMAWFYEVSSGGEKRIEIAAVTEQREAGGQTWFCYVEGTESFWVRNGKGGQWDATGYEEVDAEDGGLEAPALSFPDPEAAALFMPYPAKAGDVQEYNEDTHVTVKAVDAKIDTPDGAHRCIEYEVADPNSKEVYGRYWIAPGVGVVKIIQFPGSDEAETWVLIKRSLPAPPQQQVD